MTACGGGGGGSSDSQSSNPPANSTYSVNLSWETPVSPTDGSTFSNLAGYNLYYGTTPHLYSTTIDAGNVKAYTIQDLPAGTYYFAITAYDPSGNETGFSEERTITIP